MWKSGQPLISTLAVTLLETQCLVNQRMLGLTREFIEILLPMPPIPVVRGPMQVPVQRALSPLSPSPAQAHPASKGSREASSQPSEQVIVLAMS